MRRLAYTAVTAGGDAYEMRFPLHEHTVSSNAVQSMLTSVLDAVSAGLDGQEEVSDGDVLQALAMAMAVRARMVDVKPAVSLQLMHALIDEAFAAALQASRYQAGRA